MGHRLPACICPLIILLMSPAHAIAQTPHWTPPRTPDGKPDLQGVWTNATLTPLERPPELAGKQVLSPAEAAAYEKDLLLHANRDVRNGPDDVGAYNELWFDRGTKIVGGRRTSLIVNPPDGRVPPLTPE